MESPSSLGLIKRYGARYGRRLREKVAEIDAEVRRRHACPYCSRVAVKRKATGIWHCRKCEKIFTGKAYSLSGKILLREEVASAEEARIMPEETNQTNQEA